MTWNFNRWMIMVPPALIFSAKSGESWIWFAGARVKSTRIDLHYGSLYILAINGVCNLCAKLGGQRQFGLNGLGFYVFNLKIGFRIIQIFLYEYQWKMGIAFPGFSKNIPFHMRILECTCHVSGWVIPGHHSPLNNTAFYKDDNIN